MSMFIFVFTLDTFSRLKGWTDFDEIWYGDSRYLGFTHKLLLSYFFLTSRREKRRATASWKIILKFKIKIFWNPQKIAFTGNSKNNIKTVINHDPMYCAPMGRSKALINAFYTTQQVLSAITVRGEFRLFIFR